MRARNGNRKKVSGENVESRGRGRNVERTKQYEERRILQQFLMRLQQRGYERVARNQANQEQIRGEGRKSR